MRVNVGEIGKNSTSSFSVGNLLISFGLLCSNRALVTSKERREVSCKGVQFKKFKIHIRYCYYGSLLFSIVTRQRIHLTQNFNLMVNKYFIVVQN